MKEKALAGENIKVFSTYLRKKVLHFKKNEFYCNYFIKIRKKVLTKA